jgi:hypothetical protein
MDNINEMPKHIKIVFLLLIIFVFLQFTECENPSIDNKPKLPYNLKWDMNHDQVIETIKKIYPYCNNSGLKKDILAEMGIGNITDYNDFIRDIEIEIGTYKQSALSMLTFSNHGELLKLAFFMPAGPIDFTDPSNTNKRSFAARCQVLKHNYHICSSELDTSSGIWYEEYDLLLLSCCNTFGDPDTSYIDIITNSYDSSVDTIWHSIWNGADVVMQVGFQTGPQKDAQVYYSRILK